MRYLPRDRRRRERSLSRVSVRPGGPRCSRVAQIGCSKISRERSRRKCRNASRERPPVVKTRQQMCTSVQREAESAEQSVIALHAPPEI